MREYPMRGEGAGNRLERLILGKANHHLFEYDDFK